MAEHNTIRVSVALVNYNAGNLLADCVDSLLRSTLPVEVIVIDNASSDDSVEQLKNTTAGTDPVRIVENEENTGFSHAVNQAFELATGEFFALINPDCLVASDALQGLVDTLQSDPGCGLAGGLVFGLDGREQRGCRRREPTPLKSMGRLLHPLLSRFGIRGNYVDMSMELLPQGTIEVDAVSGAFLMVYADRFRQLGGMDEGYFLHWEDFDLCRKCRSQGWSVQFNPAALAIHYKSASGEVSFRHVEMIKNQSMVRYFRKHYPAWSKAGLVPLLLAAGWLRARITTSAEVHPAPSQHQSLGLGRQACDTALKLAIVTGATSQIGDYLLPKLAGEFDRVIAVTRGNQAGTLSNNTWWIAPEFLPRLSRFLGPVKASWFHLAPVWMGPELSPGLVPGMVDRVVAISSTSAQTKVDSRNDREVCIARQLEAGETFFTDAGEVHDVPVTLFRPTMVYGNQKNRNIHDISRFIQRFRFYPLVGLASGLRQPVHAADIANACCQVINNPGTFGKIYNLAGAEILDYKSMITRVFEHHRLPVRFVHLPVQLFGFLLQMASVLPGFRHLTSAMADRMNKDLIFSVEDAVNDFGYQPGTFTLDDSPTCSSHS